MTNVLFLLFLLLLTFIYKKNKEGLDNCPQLDGPTTTGIQNEATLSSISTNVDKINIMAKLVENNTANIETLNNNLKDILDLKQKVNELVTSEKNMKQSLLQFGEQLQSTGLSVANTTKNMPIPVPQIHANPYTGKWRTS